MRSGSASSSRRPRSGGAPSRSYNCADLLPDPAGVKIGRHTYRIVWDGLIDLSGAYHQPSRLNSAASAAASTAMNPSTAANAQELSKDGVKWKFIP